MAAVRALAAMPRELGRVLIEVRSAAETHAVLLTHKLLFTPGPSFFLSRGSSFL